MSPPPQQNSTMSSSSNHTVWVLILRLITLVMLVITIAILSSSDSKVDVSSSFGSLQSNMSFKNAYGYRYMLATAVIVAAYTLFQVVSTVMRMCMPDTKNSNSNGSLLFDFFGDKIASYLLATGSSAGFAVTNQLNLSIRSSNSESIGQFCVKAYASSSLHIVAFICAILLSIVSSFNLRKRP